MNILHSISPVRGVSVTFQREKENTTEQRNKIEPHVTTRTENITAEIKTIKIIDDTNKSEEK